MPSCLFNKTSDCPLDSLYKLALHWYDCIQDVDCSLEPKQCDTETVLWQKIVKIWEIIGCCSCDQVFVPLSRRVDTLVNSGLAGGGELSVDLALTLDIDNLPVSPGLELTDLFAASKAGVEQKVTFQEIYDEIANSLDILNLVVDTLCFNPGLPLNNNAPDFILTLNGDNCVTKTVPTTYALSTRTISTPINSGLAGGGNLSADRSLTLDLDNLPAAAPLNALDVFGVSQGGVEAKTTLGDIDSYIASSIDILNLLVDSLCFNPGFPVEDLAPAYLLGINGGSCVVKVPVPVANIPQLIYQGQSVVNGVPHAVQADHDYNFPSDGTYFISLSWRVNQAELIDSVQSFKNGNTLFNSLQFDPSLVGSIDLPISWIDTYNAGVQNFYNTLIRYANPADSGNHILNVLIWQLA